jgi:hypothetical protein
MMMRLILILFLSAICSTASAFDSGYHADLTRATLRDFGFEPSAIEIAQVENWLTDYYSNSPTSPQAVKEQLVKLHFDNLFNSKEVTWYWSRLSQNTINAAKQAATDDDPHRMLTILAISLHAVQDFYSHSNWCDAHPRPAAGYSTRTLLQGGAPATTEIFTGYYDSMPGIMPPPGHPSHGGYDDGLNRDGQDRPRWDEAYVFAYVASWEWVARLKSEVDSVNPAFWAKVKQLSFSGSDLERLKLDSKAAYRISLWVTGSGANGHWKGKLSGHAPSLAKITLEWTTAPDSKSVKQFKVAKIQDQLTPDLYLGGTAPALGSFPKYNLDRKVVRIHFVNAKEKGDEGILEPRIDVSGDADFFAKVKVAGIEYTERVIQERKTIDNPWSVIAIVDASLTDTAIRVDVLDEDFAASGDDDTCDVNPTEDKKHLDFKVRLADAELSGDVTGLHRDAASAVSSSGKKSDKDRAVVKFFVDVVDIK